jgi:hypothetical protein
MEVEINERALVSPAKFIEGRKQALFFGVARSSPVEVEISTEEGVALKREGVEAEKVESGLAMSRGEVRADDALGRGRRGGLYDAFQHSGRDQNG